MVTNFAGPLETLLGLQRSLEEAMSNDWFGSSTSSRGAFPPINSFQQDGSIVIIAEIPGVGRDEIEIQVKNRQVRLTGKKTIGYGDKVSIHRRERDSGQFDRTVSVPFEIDADGVKAEYSNGVLALFVPRAESDKPRVISID
jgi:HSP20 family protein